LVASQACSAPGNFSNQFLDDRTNGRAYASVASVRIVCRL